MFRFCVGNDYITIILSFNKRKRTTPSLLNIAEDQQEENMRSFALGQVSSAGNFDLINTKKFSLSVANQRLADRKKSFLPITKYCHCDKLREAGFVKTYFASLKRDAYIGAMKTHRRRQQRTQRALSRSKCNWVLAERLAVSSCTLLFSNPRKVEEHDRINESGWPHLHFHIAHYHFHINHHICPEGVYQSVAL